MEDRADADSRQDSVFLGVHAGEGVVFMIIMSKAMQDSVQDVQQDLMLKSMSTLGRLTPGFVNADEDVNIQRSAGSGRKAIGKIERQNVRRAGHIGILQMGRSHFRIGHELNPDLSHSTSNPRGMFRQEPKRHQRGRINKCMTIGKFHLNSQGLFDRQFRDLPARAIHSHPLPCPKTQMGRGQPPFMRPPRRENTRHRCKTVLF